MKIDDLNSTISALSSIVKKSQRQSDPPQHPSSTAKTDANGTPLRTSASANAISSNRILYNKIESANDQNLDVARKIRAVDKTMELVEEKVGKMRTFLEGVVKAYPPYPPGSTERVKAMRQFAALRKQIDQLVYPPPDEEAPLPGTSAPKPSQGDPWQLSGNVNLDLPELSMDAGDAELNDALNSLGSAYSALQQQHKAFIADANRLISTLK